MIKKQTKDLFEFDRSFLPERVAGIDEAGRGPLCGPVVCAACVMPPYSYIDGINDSKILSEKLRERLYEQIILSAVAYGVGIIEPQIIDKINILQATKLGMKTAVENLKIKPTLLIVDAVKNLDVDIKQKPIIKGDATSYSVAAASIIAKVTRDRIMRGYDALYPGYGFAKNKGYGTAAHIEALKRFGKTPIHRETFIKNFVKD